MLKFWLENIHKFQNRRSVYEKRTIFVTFTKVLFTDLNSCIALAIVHFEFPAPKILAFFASIKDSMPSLV